MAHLRATRQATLKAVAIVFLVVTLAIFTWIAPPHAELLHNVLHHLNILPFMLAGIAFGWRGALGTALLATALQTPSIHRRWHREPLDAQDQVVELSTFGAAGVLAGMLSDRERMQRRRVEATKSELEDVYTELRQNVEQLKKTERLTAAGQLAASLAHEIRNPLASISGAAGILARGQANAESRAECLEILTIESQRLNRLLTNFLVFARPRLPRFRPTDAASILQSVTSLAQHEAANRNVKLELDTGQDSREIECDAEQIKQSLLNLILNAIQAAPAGSKVLIKSRFEDSRVFLEVRDQGSGISAADSEHVFEPFFTTKKEGTGLGLAIALNIATQHRGSLSCRQNEGGGTTFSMELPCQATSQVTGVRL